MEQLIITISKDIKQEFQIKTIINNTSMTAVLTEAIKKYLQEK